MRIVYSTPSLYLAGGVERVLTTKVNHLADVLGHDVTVVLTDGGGHKPYYPLSPRVRVVQLGIGFERMWNKPLWRRALIYLLCIWRYRRALRRTLMELRADIVVTTMRREVNFICNIPDGSVKVGELHVTRSHYRHFEDNERGTLRRWLERLWGRQLLTHARRLDAMVVLTEGEREAWPELDNVYCIANPLPFDVANEPAAGADSRRVIAVGRYSYQKGFDMLLQAWADVHRQHPTWHLDIYGDGDRTPYEQMTRELGLTDEAATLHPAATDIRSRYSESSLFVLSSRYEGFGMVIIEAMACGLPVVSFDCPSGPAEIIGDNSRGMLVACGDVAALAAAISQAIGDEAWRKKAAHCALERAHSYSESNIMGQWQRLFTSLIGKQTQKKPHR